MLKKHYKKCAGKYTFIIYLFCSLDFSLHHFHSNNCLSMFQSPTHSTHLEIMVIKSRLRGFSEPTLIISPFIIFTFHFIRVTNFHGDGYTLMMLLLLLPLISSFSMYFT